MQLNRLYKRTFIMLREFHAGTRLIIGGVCLLLGLSSTVAVGQPAWLGSGENWGTLLGGAVTTIFAHELGHLAVAEIEDADAYLDGTTIKYHNLDGTDQQNLRLSSAGFQAQWLVSEYAFRQLEQSGLSPQRQSWNAGLVLGHLGISAAYLTFLKDHEYGDVRGIAQATGLSNDEVAVLLNIPALLDGWRLFNENAPRWSAWVSRGYKAAGITLVWTF